MKVYSIYYWDIDVHLGVGFSLLVSIYVLPKLCKIRLAPSILIHHNIQKPIVISFGIDPNEDELDLLYIYWIPMMHKNPYKHRFIAGSARCPTKPLSILLTKLLTHIKQGLQKYCETAYSRSGVNQMWILKNSKELLEHLKSPNFNNITSIKSFDFSTLYTTIPHDKLEKQTR